MKNKTLITFVPLFLFSTTGVSCNNKVVVMSKIQSRYIYEPFRAIAPTITSTDFNKYFNKGDIIKMTISGKDGIDYSVTLPYVTEYAEAGYYGPCLCDESDGTAPKGDYIDISFAMHPFVKLADNFFNQDVKFELVNKGGYKDTMEAVNCTSKLTLAELDYDSLAYANFRDVNSVGDLKDIIKRNVLFRGASPIESDTTGTDRYIYADKLIKSRNIGMDICLNRAYGSCEKTDNVYSGKECGKKIAERMNNDQCPYVCKKYQGNQDWSEGCNNETKSYMCSVPLNTDFYSSDDKNEKWDYLNMCGKVFDNIANKKDPISNEDISSFYIHCEEGKDRTGFIIAALEALCVPETAVGTQYLNDIVADFMLSYKNYFNITLADDINRYQKICDLTIYRHTYGLCLEDASKTFSNKDFDWLNTDSRVETERLLKQDGNNLHKCAKRYIHKALSRFYTRRGDDPSKISDEATESIDKILDKLKQP